MCELPIGPNVDDYIEPDRVGLITPSVKHDKVGSINHEFMSTPIKDINLSYYIDNKLDLDNILIIKRITSIYDQLGDIGNLADMLGKYINKKANDGISVAYKIFIDKNYSLDDLTYVSKYIDFNQTYGADNLTIRDLLHLVCHHHWLIIIKFNKKIYNSLCCSSFFWGIYINGIEEHKHKFNVSLTKVNFIDNYSKMVIQK